MTNTAINDVMEMQKDLDQHVSFRSNVRTKLNEAIGVLNGPQYDSEGLPRDIRGEIYDILSELLEQTEF